MKAVRGMLILTVVLAASTQVFALTSPPWAGTFSASVSNWSMSRAYTGYLAGFGPASNPNPAQWQPVTPGFAYTSPDTQLDYLAPTGPNVGQNANETSWGVFRFYDIGASIPSGDNGMSSKPPGSLWHDGAGNKEIVGIFYGQIDTAVTFYQYGNDPMQWTQAISAAGAEYKMWYQNFGLFDNGANEVVNDNDVYEPGEEGYNLRFGPDKYKTIGYDMAGNPLPVNVSEPVLWGQSKDLINDVQQNQIEIMFFPWMNKTGMLNTFIWLNADQNYSWQPKPGNDDFYFQRIFPYDLTPGSLNPLPFPGNEAHLALNAVSKAASAWGWQLESDRNSSIFGSVVPEPVTMISLALGGMGLVGYIRKRRNR